MKARYHLIIILSITIIYLLMINSYATIILTEKNINNTKEINRNYGISEKIGVMDSVSISVLRTKWYGKTSWIGDSSNFYLFYILKIPLKVKETEFIWWHITFLSLIFFYSLIISKGVSK